jgi:hypothetical protein
MTEEEMKMKQVSGHSIRVGATQDMLALNIDLASVMGLSGCLTLPLWHN